MSERYYLLMMASNQNEALLAQWLVAGLALALAYALIPYVFPARWTEFAERFYFAVGLLLILATMIMAAGQA